MPRKPPPKPAKQKYSWDLKGRAFYQAFVLKMKPTEIAISLDMSVRVVQHVLKMWREIGDVCKGRKGKGRAPLMKNDAVRVYFLLV